MISLDLDGYWTLLPLALFFQLNQGRIYLYMTYLDMPYIFEIELFPTHKRMLTTLAIVIRLLLMWTNYGMYILNLA